MIECQRWPARIGWATSWMLLLAACVLGPRPALAQSSFPSIPIWARPGRIAADTSLVESARSITVRWLRDPDAEARRAFGGYRLYRVYNSPDSSRMQLIRRFSVQEGDSLFLWHFARITSATPIDQRIATFVDPDSNGSFQKRCRVVDRFGRCVSRGDSIFVLVAPPGPHDGFRTWYAITYEERNTQDLNFIDLYVRDPTCTLPDTTQCPNLNNKLHNLTGPVEATPGPTQNLQTVAVVPNPFRAHEAWDQAGGNEVHFINLPADARIRVYSVSGDLVRELRHQDPVRDFEVWDLKNEKGEDVASGIYVYRVESANFAHQSRFVVIR
jgi:hypothetical protein